jgi:hypothetical protein
VVFGCQESGVLDVLYDVQLLMKYKMDYNPKQCAVSLAVRSEQTRSNYNHGKVISGLIIYKLIMLIQNNCHDL